MVLESILYQVNQVTKKVNKALFELRFIKTYTYTQALRKQLIETLIIPHFTYCSFEYLDLTCELKIHLQRLSNACIRYIYDLRKEIRITPYRNGLGWMRTEIRRTYFMALIMYKVKRLKKPSYLIALFQPYVSLRPTWGVRQDLKVTHVAPTSFQGEGAPLWNSLPTRIRDLTSLSFFKRRIREHLIDGDG